MQDLTTPCAWLGDWQWGVDSVADCIAGGRVAAKEPTPSNSPLGVAFYIGKRINEAG